jgi:hypothetical protein
MMIKRVKCCVSSRNSSVGIVTDYGLDGWGSIPDCTRYLTLSTPPPSAQTGSGAQPVSYPKGTGGGALSLGVKRPGPEVDHSLPSSAKVKNGGAIPPFPPMSSWYIV